ncbi:MAG TPA: methyl-accepting chemotaxis protein, partial [Opitutus sp.]|nr:methyl-accepting chemotaxis protein [Opitutus sp.]
MNWILNFSTRAKLLLCFGLMVVLLGAVIGTAYVNVTALGTAQRNLSEKDFALVENLAQLLVDLNRQRAEIQRMMLETDRGKQEEIAKDLAERTKEADDVMRQILELGREDAAFSLRLRELDALRKEYRQTRDLQIARIYDGKQDEARQLSISVQADRYEKIRAMEQQFGKEAREDVRAALARTEAQTRGAIRLFTGIGGVALLLAIIMTLFLNRAIADPLRRITGLADRMAAGDLTSSIPAEPRADEIGQLSQAFARLSDNLRSQIRNMAEATSVLSTSATEISTSTSQFSASATETASAVGETTTTVEEVRQTAQVSSQKAKAVSETAQKVAQISQAGRKATEETVEGIGRIRTQMDSIAESMVRLSEQSQAIGQIVTTVEDLAAQSNLLAVNAAIEAAKAGEHGKGFAIVAQEVKSLAEQSKQATGQVRSILNDIQKATTAAVMATEQGSKAVEAGVKQSTQA